MLLQTLQVEVVCRILARVAGKFRGMVCRGEMKIPRAFGGIPNSTRAAIM